MKTYVDFKLEKNLSSELLNMDKTYDFVIKPLKNDPLETTVCYIFFLEIEIFTTKIVNSKSLKKICRQLWSTMNVLKLEFYFMKKCSCRESNSRLLIESTVSYPPDHQDNDAGSVIFL